MSAMSATLLSDPTPVLTAVPAPARPVTVSAAAAGMDPTGLAAAVVGGAMVIDLRSAAERGVTGVLPGALAIDLDHLAERLDPARPGRLRAAAPGADWVLVSGDGVAAAQAARVLRARGLAGVRWLRGGFAALQSVRATAAVSAARQDRKSVV